MLCKNCIFLWDGHIKNLIHKSIPEFQNHVVMTILKLQPQWKVFHFKIKGQQIVTTFCIKIMYKIIVCISLLLPLFRQFLPQRDHYPTT